MQICTGKETHQGTKMEQKEKGLLSIVFLKLFTKEIISTLVEEKRRKHKIEVEKLKQTITEPQKIVKEENNASVQQVFREIIKNPDKKQEIKRKQIIHRENIPPQNYKPETPILTPVKKEPISTQPMEEKSNFSKPGVQEVGSYYASMEKSMSSTNKPAEYPEHKIREQIRASQPKQILRRFLEKTPVGPKKAPIEKITPFLRDNTIVSIECPGPGKNILVKKYNQVNVTKLALTEEEIKSIIEYYAKEAKIPLVGGILKAAVGNNIISAVISEFVGSRFVINKITPYSLINQHKQ